MELNNSIVTMLYAHTYGRSAQALFYGGAEIHMVFCFIIAKRVEGKMKSHVEKKKKSEEAARAQQKCREQFY